ncbi:hypothetical protein BZA77DRAFT_280800 [Pyronema omphalodes]|nr:hypothetical protein BZA77DRAFT_280800 [Pyronema omphalodes]
MKEFCKRLPKIELHAHLSGSIRRDTLHQIWQQKKSESPELALEDPLLVIPEEGVTDINAFFPLFSKYIYALINTVSAVEFSTRAVLNDFCADGVIYLELRTTPRDFPETGLTKQKYVETVLDTISQFNASTGKMKAKLILSIDRRDDVEKAWETVELAKRYKNEGVCGVDLCGDPLKGNPSIFAPHFAAAKSAGLGLTIHFAELPQSSTDEELLTLLSYHPDRLGHVIHCSEIVKTLLLEKRMALELCISCNVKVKMDPQVKAFGEHHFGEWWNGGRGQCTLAVSTDDVGVFYSELSDEYYIVHQHFGLRKRQLWELARGAVEAVFARDEERDLLRIVMEEFRESEGFGVE